MWPKMLTIHFTIGVMSKARLECSIDFNQGWWMVASVQGYNLIFRSDKANVTAVSSKCIRLWRVIVKSRSQARQALKLRRRTTSRYSTSLILATNFRFFAPFRAKHPFPHRHFLQIQTVIMAASYQSRRVSSSGSAAPDLLSSTALFRKARVFPPLAAAAGQHWCLNQDKKARR